MLKDRKTVTENDLHSLVQAFQSQPSTAYGDSNDENQGPAKNS